MVISEENYQEPDGATSERPENNVNISEAEYSKIVKDMQAKIEQLEARFKKEQPLGGKEKEKIIKQEIKTHLRELQQTPSFAAPIATRDEAHEIKKLPPEQQVGALVSLVFERGLGKAIAVAKGLKESVLDEFHDILTDRYYKELIEKKIIKF